MSYVFQQLKAPLAAALLDYGGHDDTVMEYSTEFSEITEVPREFLMVIVPFPS